MAYTTGFDHDLFISFSHEDNLAPEGQEGWVELFRESLEIWLQRRGLKGLDVWWDKEQLRGNTDFDARCERALNTTALQPIQRCRLRGQSPCCARRT